MIMEDQADSKCKWKSDLIKTAHKKALSKIRLLNSKIRISFYEFR
jgi:hypothetical protein